MKYLQPSFTVPAAPEKVTACEKCVYGRGLHADWCPRAPQEIPWIGGRGGLVIDPTMPKNEIHFVSRNQILGRIVNIGA